MRYLLIAIVVAAILMFWAVGATGVPGACTGNALDNTYGTDNTVTPKLYGCDTPDSPYVWRF